MHKNSKIRKLQRRQAVMRNMKVMSYKTWLEKHDLADAERNKSLWEAYKAKKVQEINTLNRRVNYAII
jgi:hypothetical protein